VILDPLGAILGPVSIVVIILGWLLCLGLAVWWKKSSSASTVAYSSLLPDNMPTN
jgi:hypothetical protein